MSEQRLRAYRFALDPTPAQHTELMRHAGAARWGYNHALGLKSEAHRRWRLQVDELVMLGWSEKAAYKEASVKVPRHPEIKKRWNLLKGDEKTGTRGICAWWRSVSTYAFQSAWDDADRAWKNWMDSISGRRAGRRVGQPRFKKKGRSRDSFRLHHDVKKPTIRLDGYRRLRLPRFRPGDLGTIRMHESGKRMARALARGGVVQSVTVSRGGHRWYASILVAEPDVTPGREDLSAPSTPAEPSHAQRGAGTVGVDLGVLHLAALSSGETIDNPHHLKAARRKLLKAQRALSRTQKGSNRRRKAAARLGRRHHEVAERRAAHMHQVTKQLAASWQTIVVEDLSVAGMTASARGTVDQPGRNVRAKAGLNRSILDAAPGEFRRQLAYKASWYGSTVAVCDRWYPSSKTCSNCGAVKAKLSLSERDFHCGNCGFVLDRDVNAARNIAAYVAVGSDRGQTLTARGDHVSPRSCAREAVVIEAGRPGRSSRSPRGSNPPITPDKTG